MSFWRHARAVVALPGMAAVVVPAVLLVIAGIDVGWGLPAVPAVLLTGVGGILIAAGLGMWAWTVRLLARRGQGTLAPWDPTERLVVEGPYGVVRNPMITAVAAALLGETLLFGSSAIALWFAGFVVVNSIYLPLVEEPGLARRFGPEYEAYRARVPRWVPRPRGGI